MATEKELAFDVKLQRDTAFKLLRDARSAVASECVWLDSSDAADLLRRIDALIGEDEK